MHKERLSELLNAESFTEDDLKDLETLVSEYPWFGLPRFLMLKAKHQLGTEPEQAEVSLAAVYSSDRKYLFQWIRGEVPVAGSLSGLAGKELEFLDEAEVVDVPNTGDEKTFELLDGESGADVDADEKSIPEKDESDMEEPETEEPETIPVIDPLEDDDDQEDDEVADERPDEHQGQIIAEEEQLEKDPEEKEQEPDQEATNHSSALIEQFLNSEPGVIRADKETSLEGDVSKDSVKEDDSFITDTLARIYIKQGLHAKAIYAYERLSLKYPEKSAYFAAQIEKIKGHSNL